MKAFVGVTDKDWINFLAALAGIDKVNFCQPGGAIISSSSLGTGIGSLS